MKPKRLCNHAGCSTLVEYNQTYCDKHKQEAKQNLYDNYEHRKEIGGKYFWFYKTKQWQRLSRLHRINNPMCEQCLKNGIVRKADLVDHIIEIRDDWEKRFDEDNLQSLCHSCHWQKTKEEQEKRKTKN